MARFTVEFDISNADAMEFFNYMSAAISLKCAQGPQDLIERIEELAKKSITSHDMHVVYKVDDVKFMDEWTDSNLYQLDDDQFYSWAGKQDALSLKSEDCWF